MTQMRSDSELPPARVRLGEWFTHSLGQTVLQVERQEIDRVLPDLFGYHIVQVGSLGCGDLLGSSRISHRVVLDIELPRVSDPLDWPVCEATALPIAAQSIDVVVLPHVLEFERDPHRVLRETERILIGEGHVVILGFNPWSLWGWWRLALAWTGELPWCGRFLGLARIKDWLHLLGFDIVESKHFCFRPPLRGTRGFRRLAFLERLGAVLWPYLGGAYMVVGKKRLVTLTLIGTPAWGRRLVPNGVAEPTTWRVCEKIVSERRKVAFTGAQGPGCIEIHEDPEHRRNVRSRAQQIFSQTLTRVTWAIACKAHRASKGRAPTVA